MDVSQRLQKLEEKVEENNAGIRENSAGIKENSAGIKENSAGIKENTLRLERLEKGQGRLEKQLADYFEFFKAYFDAHQEENRRYMEVLLEQNRSEQSTQGEGIKVNRVNTQKNSESIKKIREKFADHETRIRRLDPQRTCDPTYSRCLCELLGFRRNQDEIRLQKFQESVDVISRSCNFEIDITGEPRVSPSGYRQSADDRARNARVRKLKLHPLEDVYEIVQGLLPMREILLCSSLR